MRNRYFGPKIGYSGNRTFNIARLAMRYPQISPQGARGSASQTHLAQRAIAEYRQDVPMTLGRAVRDGY